MLLILNSVIVIRQNTPNDKTNLIQRIDPSTTPLLFRQKVSEKVMIADSDRRS